METPKKLGEKKLYDFTDIEKNSRSEVFEIYKEIDSILSKFDSYIGIFPVGSIAFGYSTDYSDLDIRFLLDDSKSDYLKCRETIVQYVKQHNKASDKPAIQNLVSSISDKEIIDSFKSENENFILEVMSTLSLAGKGGKIGKYRETIKNLFSKLSSEMQLDIENLFVSAETNRIHKFSGDKISNRIYGRRVLTEEEDRELEKVQKQHSESLRQRFAAIWY